MLVVGSHAMVVNGIPLSRMPWDVDLIVTPNEATRLRRGSIHSLADSAFLHRSGIVMDIEVATEGSSAARYLELVAERPSALAFRTVAGKEARVASIALMLSLKKSHRF